MIRAGKLRHLVALKRRVTTQSPTGAIVDSWSTVATTYAEISPKFGRETPTGIPRMITSFKIRYMPGVDTAMRVVWVDGTATRVFDITSAANTNAEHREWVLMGTELVGTVC